MGTSRAVDILRSFRMLATASFLLLSFAVHTYAAESSSGLLVTLGNADSGANGYNLIVDSNVESPSTYAPRCAYLAATFWNTTSNDMTNLTFFIGDYANRTAGIYPSRIHTNSLGETNLFGFNPDFSFSLTHLGGTNAGLFDAQRPLDRLNAHSNITVFWLVTYPNLDRYGHATWGPSVKADDDLWLTYDIWATAQQNDADLEVNASRTVWMRNEISAMANKIYPNNAAKVPDEYQTLLNQYMPIWTNVDLDASPGENIITEGIWYDLGNVNQGFDLDPYDGVPDYNAWLQPVGDAAFLDPGRFRLVRTYTMLIVKLKTGAIYTATNEFGEVYTATNTSGGEYIITKDNQLYYNHLPENVGVVGLVKYEYASLEQNSLGRLTPYQEAASGSDNEKFNGDFGAVGNPPLTSGTTDVHLAKAVDIAVTPPGTNLNYTVDFSYYTNSSGTSLGNPALGLALVVQDSIPTGTYYVAGSALASNNPPAGVSNYFVKFSTDHGTNWSDPGQEPVPATNVTDIQWWLNGTFRTNSQGTVRFSVTVPAPYAPTNPWVLNAAGLSFGYSKPFLWAYAKTLIIGTNSLNGTVFWDDGRGGATTADGLQTGTEYGLSNVMVSLYYGVYSNSPMELMATTNTFTNGTYLFTNLPDGYYEIRVHDYDTNIPYGSAITLPVSINVSLDPARTNVNPVISTNNNFAFCPVLELNKTRLGPSPVLAHSNVTFAITVTNRIPAPTNGLATYTCWATNFISAQQNNWQPPSNCLAAPDYLYTTSALGRSSSEMITLNGYRLTALASRVRKVEVLIPTLCDVTADPNDYVTFDVSNNGTNAFTTNITIGVLYTNIFGSSTTGTIILDVTAGSAWAWNNFSSTGIVSMALTSKKSGGSKGCLFAIDAVGFRITTDAPLTNNTHFTLQPVPLTDYFRTNELQYVSAIPAPLSWNTNTGTGFGTIYWPDIGPLYPGGTSTVYVTFKTLDPPSGVLSNVFTNFCYVTNVYYQDSRPANSASSSATVSVLRAGSIGDYVWWDMNGNTLQDETNAGIPGVTVILTYSNYPTRWTNVTDSTGWYIFEGLVSNGLYTVMVMTNTIIKPPYAGAITNTYTYDNTRTNATRVSLTNLEDFVQADFGYKYVGFSNMIIGSVWHDINRSGTPPPPDTGEPWLTNVTVYLYSNTTIVATNRTSIYGDFKFVGNFTGTYSVVVVTNSGMMTNLLWTQSYDTDDTNRVITTSNRVSFTFLPGDTVKEADFSYYQRGNYAIGDRVFYDWNVIGVQDDGDIGITGVTVRLYADSNSNLTWDAGIDQPLGETETTIDGAYLFTNILSGNYLVVVDRNDPQLPSPSTVTFDPYGDFDGISYVTIVTNSNYDQDFGYHEFGHGTIGDYVWVDSNGNGLQDEDPATGTNGITVYLLYRQDSNSSYSVISNTVTATVGGNNGYYYFTGLGDGDYRVLVATNDTDIPINAQGYRYVPSTPITVDCTISNGNTFLDADFGFAAPAAIGDRIFWDSNGDGLQGANWTNEPGITGVTVRLYLDVDGNRILSAGDSNIATTVTTTNGYYLFAGLPPANYVVVVDTNSSPITNKVLSCDPEADGAPAYTLTNSMAIDAQHGRTLVNDQTYLQADFGFVPLGVIGDTVWIDQNGNGIRDGADGNPGATEYGIPGVTVELYTNGVFSRSTTTDIEGIYTFSNLRDGTYVVKVITNDMPAGLVQNYDPDGTNDNQAINIIMTNGHVIAIGAETNWSWRTSSPYGDLQVDFGYRYPGTNMLSGTIGLDDPTYNGVMGNGPSGYATNEVPYYNHQVSLNVWDDDGDNILELGELWDLTFSVSTDINGDYSFTNLPTSTNVFAKYLVTYITRPNSEVKLTTVTGCTPATIVSNIVDAFTNTVSAWQGVPISLGPVITNVDFAFKETRYDYGDLPQSYRTLLQFDPEGARNRVMNTPDLYLGATVDTEINGIPSAYADGDDLNKAIDDEDGVVPVGVWRDGGIGQVQVTVGEGSGWLLAYMDFNNNGTFNDFSDMVLDEAVSASGGIGGTGVYNSTFNVATNTFSGTNATTIYARFRLFPGSPTYPHRIWYQGTGDNGETEDYRWEFGALGDTVWKDFNLNGIRDAGEPPITNVTVYVDLNHNGSLDAGDMSTVTDTNGYYHFGGFTPGTYTVSVVAATVPAGLVPVYDLDGTNTPHVATVTMTNGQVRMDVDFGYVGMVLSGLVWYDSNTNGIQDFQEVIEPLELPMSNITVRLYTADSNLLATTTTAADGRYGFDIPAIGAYFVEFVPDIYTVSPMGPLGQRGSSDVYPYSPYHTTNIIVQAGDIQDHWDMGLYALTDLGIDKKVNNSHPATNGVIWYTITLTNNGPRDAISCTVTDLWPAEIIYSNYWASQGTYNSATRIWTPGRINVGYGATLIITGRVNVTSVRQITNIVWITRVIPIDTNPLNNTSQVPIVTLAVVGRFDAVDTGSGPALEWETASEVGTAGFYLYRQVPGRDQFVRVSDEIMPAVQGSPQGGIYRIRDPGARAGKAETYRLDEIEATGATVVHGPFTVTIPVTANQRTTPHAAGQSTGEEFTSRARTSPSTEERLKARDAEARANARSGRMIHARAKTLPGDQAGGSDAVLPAFVKIEVTNNAVYFVDSGTIAGLLQSDAARVQAAIAAGSVRLTCAGKYVSYVPAQDGAGIYFYGRKGTTIYSDANVYWLSMANGPAAQTIVTAEPAPQATSVSTETVHFEKDRYQLVGYCSDPESDYWLWDYVMTSSSAAARKQFALSLSGVAAAPASATMVVSFQSTTGSGVPLEHHARVRLNGTLVGEGRWTGLMTTNMVCTFDQSLLREGSNSVEVTAIKEAGVANSMIFVESFDVTYSRTSLAVADQVVVRTGAAASITAAGFTSPAISVLDISEPGTPVIVTPVVVEPDSGLYRASFTPPGPGSICVAFAGAATPAAMKAVLPSSLKNRDNAADYVVITADALATAAQSLADYRATTGLRSKVVLVEDIYNEFNYGLPSPHALAAFTRYAWLNWHTPPRYVVLAGEGSYDYKNCMGYSENLVPVTMVACPQGIFPSDSAYADINEDGMPDLAIGRLPALTGTELQRLVDKIKAYESGAQADWQKQIIMTADNPDTGGRFALSSDRIAGLIPDGYTTRKIHMPNSTVAPLRAQLLPALNQGSLFMNYFGHGGLDRFAAEGLLTSTDAAALTNGVRMPVVTAMTCASGHFASPGYDSISETLLLRAGGGAIAVWAPSGMSLNDYAETLARNFYEDIFRNGEGVIGEAILAAKQRYAADSLTKYIPTIYNLLGDPALGFAGMTAQRRSGDEYRADVVISGLSPDEAVGGPATATNRYVAGLTYTSSVPAFVENNGVRYACTGWTGTGGAPSSGNTVSVVFTAIDGTSLKWQWQKQYKLTVVAGEHGSVKPDGVWYVEGASATVIALPDRSYRFHRWTGDIQSAANPLLVSMDRAFTVSAGFAHGAPRDFDGDGTTDLSVYNPGPGTWHVVFGSGKTLTRNWGWDAVTPVPGDYDGDGRTDIAVYYPPSGTWYINYSSGGSMTQDWGWDAAVPVPGDYDGDGTTDLAVYYPLEGTWYISCSGGGTLTRNWGWDEAIPVPGDYDGDGRTDLAVYYPLGGTWYISFSAGGTMTQNWGWDEAIPVPGDYDGDGRTDLAVFYPLGGTWYIRYASGGVVAQNWGWNAVTPVPGDYDGDGKTDIAVYYTRSGAWYINYSSGGSKGLNCGGSAWSSVSEQYQIDKRMIGNRSGNKH